MRKQIRSDSDDDGIDISHFRVEGYMDNSSVAHRDGVWKWIIVSRFHEIVRVALPNIPNPLLIKELFEKREKNLIFSK